MCLVLALARAEERRRRADAAEVAAAEDDARHVDAAAAERAVLHARDCYALALQIVRVVEQCERVAGIAGRAASVAAGGEGARVLPEDARACGRIVDAAAGPPFVASQLGPGRRPESRRATSASTSSGGGCWTCSTPVARNCSSAFSFAASLRSSCSDGTRSPASSREMYAAEQPGKGELPLGEARRQAGVLESSTDRRWVVDV